MPVQSQEYDSCYPFVWCVWAFGFVIFMGLSILNFFSEFSIFVILLFDNCALKDLSLLSCPKYDTDLIAQW